MIGSMAHRAYCVGIDLGTTNTVVSYVRLTDHGKSDGPIAIFPIEQLVAPGTIAARPYLPSLRYHPMAGELSPSQCALPWKWEPLEGEPVAVFGEWAQQLGRQTDGRAVLSAKSWLCHRHVDRLAPILPWGYGVEVAKISPVLAQASLINYCRQAWDHAHPDYPLRDQSVVITVPASFDESARAFTHEAAQLAGLANVALLEEPHAACYDWLFNHRDNVSALKDVRLLLVIDVGGGTSDFSLMAIAEQEGQITVDRVAVGDHLLLGGDNIDLAVSLRLEQQLSDGKKRFSTTELSQIQQYSQWAKEQLLQIDAPEQVAMTILGRGAALLQQKQTVSINRDEVQQLVLDHFLAPTPWGDLPNAKRSGVVEYGLPFENDPCFSKHLCQFLQRNQRVCRESLGAGSGVALPDALLFNGGFFQSELTQKRMVQVIQGWSESPSSSLKVLANADPSQAVARGAVAYQLARRGEMLSIGGGAPRDYWLVVGNPAGEREMVCILPKGSAEGVEQTLSELQFKVITGELVQFSVLTTDQDQKSRLGDRCSIPPSAGWLPPMFTAVNELPDDAHVMLASTYSELGVLQLSLITADGSHRHGLNFDLRAKSYQVSDIGGGHSDQLIAARQELIACWQAKGVDPKALKAVRASVEKHCGARDQWNVETLRYMADGLIPLASKRRRSEWHEQYWLNWLGFCLRPGVGQHLDSWRLNHIWPLWNEGLHFSRQRQGWIEWWTFWRRVSAGLNSQQQHTIFHRIEPWIDPANLKRRAIQADVKDKGYESAVRLIGSLEKLSLDNKKKVGSWLLQRLAELKEPDESWWSLGALGSRYMVFGGDHLVLPPAVVESWIDQAMQHNWHKKPFIAHAVAMMARRCGRREHDVSEECRALVLNRLSKAKASPAWLHIVDHHVVPTVENSNQVFGENLPEGLLIV